MSALEEIITVPGHVAMEEMVRLLADRPNTGLHPVLFGSKIHADSMAENCLRVEDANSPPHTPSPLHVQGQLGPHPSKAIS